MLIWKNDKNRERQKRLKNKCWAAEKESKEECIHQSPYCDAENKQADGLIVLLCKVSHLGILSPPAWLGKKKAT